MKQLSIDLRRGPEDVHPLHREIVDADAISRADVLAWDRGGRNPTTLARCDGPEAAVATALDGSSLVASYALSGAGGTTYAFVRQTERRMDPTLRDALTEPAVVPVPPIAYEEDGTVAFRLVGTHAALGEFVGALDAGSHEVTGLWDYRGRADLRNGRGDAATPGDAVTPSEGGTRRVTERQREALRAAVEAGYYAVPRTGSLADVAATLGCAESTASELLRNAQSRVVRGFVDRRGERSE